MIDGQKIKGPEGFTLIEILAVIAIIGVLAAVAVPQFASYRRKGFDSDVKSNIKNASTAEEAYFVDHQTYTASLPTLNAYNFRQSSNVTLAVLTATASEFAITAAVIQGCTPGTGVWSFATTAGIITGTRCN